jgi:pimeloyl-ACP methyl ester carboxylesterase
MKSNTIVLIHGLWLTPRSWELFSSFFERCGWRVLAPAWPRMKGEVEEIRRDPSALAGLGVLEIADHYENVLRGLSAPPILMGHSFGGLIVQMLLDRGLGSAGVAIDSAAPKGVFRLPFSAIRAAKPVLSNPANYRRTVALSLPQFQYGFANTMGEHAARAAYERYVIPGPGRPIFQAATANLHASAATRVNYLNHDRAPLLLIAGGADHQVPPSMNRSNYRKYAGSRAITEFREFAGRSHLITAQEGWQEVAEYALTWAQCLPVAGAWAPRLKDYYPRRAVEAFQSD